MILNLAKIVRDSKTFDHSNIHPFCSIKYTSLVDIINPRKEAKNLAIFKKRRMSSSVSIFLGMISNSLTMLKYRFGLLPPPPAPLPLSNLVPYLLSHPSLLKRHYYHLHLETLAP
jgi:hypothetical protein